MVWLMVLACTSAPAPEPRQPTFETLTLPAPTDDRYAASQILVSWKGAVNAPVGVARSEAEAEVLAHDLLTRAALDFAAVAREHSDGQRAARGGHLGVYATGTLVPAVERAVASVAVGELAPLTRSPFGWHILRREAIEETQVAHILVSHSGAQRTSSQRSKEEARALITTLAQRIRDGESFADVARSESDDSSASRGGSLGRVARGAMVPAFEDAAFSLSPGVVSDVVETPYGFHLLLGL